MRATLLLFPSVVLLAVVCVDCTPLTDTTTVTTTQYEFTSVSVDPAFFLGGVTCGSLSGEMQSYVATVTDVTDPTRPFALPSSPPTACSQPVRFEYVNVGSRYTAVVDGYEQPASALVPACGLSKPTSCTADADCGVSYGCTSRCLVTQYEVREPKCLASCGANTACYKTCALVSDASKLTQACGSASTDKGEAKACSCLFTPVTGERQMYDRKTGKPVAPRWQTPSDYPCGADAPAVAQSYTNVVITGCGALEDHGTPGPTVINLYPHATLPDAQKCYPDGTVKAFDVTPLDPTLAKVAGVMCSDKDQVTFTQGLTPGTSYIFRIDAYEDGFSLPTQTASCFATARANQTVVAVCDPLAPAP